MDNSWESLLRQLPPWFQDMTAAVPKEERKDLTELRLFCGQHPLWVKRGEAIFYNKEIISKGQLQKIFHSLCHGSVHSFEQELKEGFVPLEGGHRVGICGTAVYRDGIRSGVRDISSINIRLARPCTGCARNLYQEMERRGMAEGSFLLVGAPASGKTTLLRDYARILAGGDGDPCRLIALLDERSELSDGFDLGRSTHVLKGLPKTVGILQALRTLAPKVILCDEIGTAEEAKLLLQGLQSGCRFIGSIHGENWQQLQQKAQFRPFLEQKALDAVVFLKQAQQPGQIREIHEIRGSKNETVGLSSDFPQHGLGWASP